MVNNNLRNRFTLLLIILIAPLAGVSAAGLLDTGQADYPNTSAVIDTHTDIKTDASDDTTDTTSTSSASATAGAAIDTRSSAGLTAGADSEANDNASFTLDRDSDEVKGALGPQVSADNVSNAGDLKAFAATELRNDENLSSMAFESGNVEVAYQERARLLGIIPTTVNVGVTAHDDGTVDFDYPWYSFLMITNRGDIESAIKSEVSAYASEHSTPGTPNTGVDASSTASTSAPVISDAKNKAELAARIQAILRAHLVGENGDATSTQGSM